MRQPTIRGWAWIAASLALASLGALGAVSAIALAPHTDMVRQATAPILPLYSAATAHERDLRDELAAAYRWVASGDSTALADVRLFLAHTARAENPLFESGVPSHLRDPLVRADSVASAAEAQIAWGVADQAAGRHEQARVRLRAASADRRRLATQMSTLVALTVAQARAVEERFAATAQRARVVTVVSVIAALALLAGSIVALRRRVIRPFARLHDDVRALSAGNLAHRAAIHAEDEIGELARDVNRMAEALEGRLRQQDRLAALGELAAGVAHELNNPLQVILAQASHADQGGLPKEGREAMRLIQEHARRAGRVVQGLLAFVRARAAERQPCDVNEIVGDTLDLLEYQLRSDEITLVVRRGPTLPAVRADPGQIEQVLVNLLANARHAALESAGTRTVLVETRAETDTVLVAVEDSGPGVPEPLKRRIFDPFFTTKAADIGTGLGLAIAGQIANAHGGTLSLAPGTLGGARFELRLPAAAGEAVPAAAAAPRAEAAGRRLDGVRILVADDEAAVRSTLNRYFSRLGARVTTASDGAEALDQIRNHDFDAVILDLKMPVIGGWDVVQAVQRERPSLAGRIVVLSGDITALLEMATAEHLAPWRVLEKPADLQAIHHAVARAAGLVQAV